jgi:hypothetical protein
MRDFYRRQFLNTEEHGGVAGIQASVERRDSCIDAEFCVNDCNRMVSLDFGVYTHENSANVRQKVIKFRKAVVAFEAALIAALNEFDKQK